MQTVMSTAHSQASEQTGLRSAPGRMPAPAPSQLGFGRWIAGPLVAAAVGVLTLWVAGLMSTTNPGLKNRGKLRLSSDPEGATVLVDGKVHPSPTPTVIEGEIGATLRVGFRLDGYLDKEADVFVGEGERPFRAKLERRELTPVVVALPHDEPPPTLAPPVKEEHSHSKRDREPKRERIVPTTIAPSMKRHGDPIGARAAVGDRLCRWREDPADAARQPHLDRGHPHARARE